MAKLQELPDSAQKVMLQIGSGSKTVYQLVEELGWSQTEVQKWVDGLEESGWLESKSVPDRNPMGGAATAYKRKETV